MTKGTLGAWTLAFWISAYASSAQTVTARLTGNLTDPDGLPVPAAEVIATHARTNVRYTTSSNEIGFFSLSELPAGKYLLKVERSGFKTVVTEPLTLEVGQMAHAPLALEVGRVEERVVVEYRLPVLQTESAVVGEVVSGQTASTLPLSGRNIAQLALLLPGTVSTAPASMAQPKVMAFGRPFVNGHREQNNSFVLDGVDVTEPLDNLPGYQPSPEALDEIRIETNNYSAEHGNLAGALIHAIVKSGTSELRGSIFEFMRDDRLNANPWEANRVGAQPDALSQHTFGATLGGPVVKEKLFFFADYQELRKREIGHTVTSVAPLAWRRGDFSAWQNQVTIVDPLTRRPFPGNVIPPERIHPTASALLGDTDLYPLPNRAGWPSNFVSDELRRNRSHQGDLKLTAHLTARDSGFVRFSYQHFERSRKEDARPATLAEVQRAPFASGVMSWSHAFGVGGLSEARIGYTRMVYRTGFEDWAGLGAANVTFGLDDRQSAPGLSLLWLGSELGAIGNAVTSTDNTETVYFGSERVSVLRGRHGLKAGAQWLGSRVTNRYAGNSGALGYHAFTGAFSEFGFSDFLLGMVASKGRGFQKEPWEQVQNRIGLFAEDSFKARRNLTLILGLRWSFFSPLVEIEDRQVNFDLATGNPRQAGQDGNSRALYDPFYGGFEPRLGLAWTPHGRLAIRAGYGIVQSMEGTGANLRLTQNPPYFYELGRRFDKTTGPGRLGFSDLQPEPELAGSLRFYPPDLKPQLTQQWNLFFEYALTGSLTANVGYVGHKATRVIVPRDYNQPLPGQGAPEDWPVTQVRRPLYAVLPDVGAVLGTSSEGNSNYNGLQVVLRQRPARGLELGASYTWSKAMSDNIGYYGGGLAEVAMPGFYQQNAYDRQGDYGPAFFDVTHNFVLSGTYEVPDSLMSGWTISTILTARTGFPITVINTSGRSLQGSLGIERPDRIGSGRVAHPTLDHRIDITAFKAAALGTFGNSGVGILRAPGYFKWDLVLSRAFDLGDRKQVTLRVQALNLLNHPNFGFPGRDLADPLSFGRITNTVDLPRQIELGVKLDF